MAKDDIKLDRIEERLNVIKPHHYVPLQVERVDARDQADEKAGRPAFLIVAAALVLAMFAGVFLFSGGLNPPADPGWRVGEGTGLPDASSVDDVCGQMWIRNTRNDAALICYLTRNVKRLCDPKEQKHLANIVTLYRIHTRINDKSPAEKRMKTTPAVAALPPAEAPAAIMAYADKLKGFKGRPLPENFELLRVTDDLLTAIIRNLGAQGYMRKWNFGLTDDPLVSKAFENLHSGVPDCKT